jgi:alanyl-tRNA synthetase
VIQKKDSIFDTDLFAEMMRVSGQLTDNVRSQRIIADHLRSATFLIADGVLPSNTDQGYILRRLIRRAVFNAKEKSISRIKIAEFVDAAICTYEKAYPALKLRRDHIVEEIAKEEEKFRKTIASGLKEFEKMSSVSGKDAFVLFSTYGFPFELTEELAKAKGIAVDKTEYEREMTAHQDLSRAGAEQKFKGGLADTSEMSVKYHTATHLLHQALRSVLGTHVEQKGSNINPERLRFDFVHPQKMTDEEKKKVEDMVNDAIKKALPVKKVTLPFAEAEKTGALHFFGEKYGDTVNVYYIGDTVADAFSKEFCGGPHVENTSVLGTFKIAKEEAVSAGVRRIKAVLQ